MAVPTNSIGVFRFISLEGNAEKVRQQLELIERPGVDGVGIFKTGARGTRFQLTSKVDAASKAAARGLYESYTALIGANPVDLVWSGLDLNVLENFQVAVLDVAPLDIRALATASGGLNSPSLGWIEARWDLVALSNT